MKRTWVYQKHWTLGWMPWQKKVTANTLLAWTRMIFVTHYE